MPPEIVQALIAQGMPPEMAMAAAYAPQQGSAPQTASPLPVPGMPADTPGALGGGYNLGPPPSPEGMPMDPAMMMMGGQMGPGATPTPAVPGFASTDPQGIADAVMSRFAEMAEEDNVDLQERQKAAAQQAPAIVEALIRQAEMESQGAAAPPNMMMGEGASPMLPPGLPMGQM